MTHTEGPWRMSRYRKDNINGGEIIPIQSNSGWIGDIRELDDARLIAAAPTLLEAAQMALVAITFPHEHSVEFAGKLLRQAIEGAGSRGDSEGGGR